jgi:hypothetical protein
MTPDETGCGCIERTNGVGGVTQVWCGKHWVERHTLKANPARDALQQIQLLLKRDRYSGEAPFYLQRIEAIVTEALKE